MKRVKRESVCTVDLYINIGGGCNKRVHGIKKKREEEEEEEEEEVQSGSGRGRNIYIYTPGVYIYIYINLQQIYRNIQLLGMPCFSQFQTLESQSVRRCRSNAYSPCSTPSFPTQRLGESATPTASSTWCQAQLYIRS